MHFFDLFEAAAANMVAGSKALLDLMEVFENVDAKVKAIKEIEHEGDQITHRVMNDLRKTFIPPIEGDDIVALAESLDDVLDYIEEAAVRLVLYKVHGPTPTAQELTRIIVQMCEEIQRTLPLLRRRGEHERILKSTVEVNRLENEADDALRRGLAELFDHPDDVLHVIKWREIYELLEGATDRGEDIANVLEGVVLRNA
jgi:predicted phosphate transport protein (TIGR00153 family)